MARSRYYTCVRGFGDNTAYFRQRPNSQVFYRKDGTTFPTTHYWPDWVKETVDRGTWKEISYCQARKLLKIKKVKNGSE
jgi:hypothetical protein